jgi:hypothetical protein
MQFMSAGRSSLSRTSVSKYSVIIGTSVCCGGLHPQSATCNPASSRRQAARQHSGKLPDVFRCHWVTSGLWPLGSGIGIGEREGGRGRGRKQKQKQKKKNKERQQELAPAPARWPWGPWRRNWQCQQAKFRRFGYIAVATCDCDLRGLGLGPGAWGWGLKPGAGSRERKPGVRPAFSTHRHHPDKMGNGEVLATGYWQLQLLAAGNIQPNADGNKPEPEPRAARAASSRSGYGLAASG